MCLQSCTWNYMYGSSLTEVVEFGSPRQGHPREGRERGTARAGAPATVKRTPLLPLDAVVLIALDRDFSSQQLVLLIR